MGVARSGAIWECGFVGAPVALATSSVPAIRARRPPAGRNVAKAMCMSDVVTTVETLPEDTAQDAQQAEGASPGPEDDLEISEGGDELLGSLSATTKMQTLGGREKASSNVVRAADARLTLKALTAKHGKGKALKKGIRAEASAEFTDLIASCGRSGLYRLGLDAFDEGVRTIGLDADMCSAALRAALSANYIEKAMKIYDNACQQGINLPDHIFSIAVSGLVAAGQVEEAFLFKNRLEGQGSKLELFGYNAIIEYYAVKGSLRKVLAILEELTKVGHKMTHFTESLVLRAVFRTGLGLPGCLDWIEEKEYELSRAALQALLEESLAINDRKGAAEVLDLMRANKKWARVRTYNAFLHYFANNNDAVGAFRTFAALKANGIVPTSQSYFSSVLAAVRSGTKLEEAESLIATASEGVLQTYHMYNTRAILAARTGQSVEVIFREMHEEGLAPDDQSFMHAFDAMSRRPEKDTRDEAVGLLRLMDELGLPGSRKSMNALLRVLRKCGAAEFAVDLYRSMWKARSIDFRLSPDYETYELVLEACANGSRMDLAVGVFRELEGREVQPTVAMYSSLVQGFGFNSDLESALGVWKEMKERGLRPNRTAYMRMVEACLQHPSGMGHALKTLEEMNAMGFSLENEAYNTLISGYGRARELEKAVNKFRQSRSGRQIDEVTLGAVLNACNSNENLPSAEEALNRMLMQGFQPTRQVMEYLEDGNAVSKSRNKMIQDLFGLSGVDIVREYLPKVEKKEYEEFQTLLSGSLKEPEERMDSAAEKKPKDDPVVAQEKLTRQKALERPGQEGEVDRRPRSRRNRRRRS